MLFSSLSTTRSAGSPRRIWKNIFKIRESDSGCEDRAECNWLIYILTNFCNYGVESLSSAITAALGLWKLRWRWEVSNSFRLRQWVNCTFRFDQFLVNREHRSGWIFVNTDLIITSILWNRLVKNYLLSRWHTSFYRPFDPRKDQNFAVTNRKRPLANYSIWDGLYTYNSSWCVCGFYVDCWRKILTVSSY
jgi:hypothetical protein